MNEFCCTCLNKNDLKHLFDVDNDGVSHYNKLTWSIVEMNFNEMKNQRFICGECCVTLNTVYNFRQTCLRSKEKLITCLYHLRTTSDTTSEDFRNAAFKTIVVKQEKDAECENEGSGYCFEESKNQSEFRDESHEEIKASALIKEESKIETPSFIFETIEETKITDENAVKECSLEKLNEESMSHSETPQDGSSSEPKERKETLTRHTEPTQNVQTNIEGLYKCEICKKSFNHKSSLKNHVRVHYGERPYECEICKESFTQNGELTMHMRIHGDKPYKCEVCNNGFNQKYYLTMHMQTHSTEKPYKCDICSNSFTLKCYLSRHMQTHSLDRPYKCEICEMSFTLKIYFTRHMRIHTGERPFICEICNKRFLHKSNLTIHIRRHSSEKPYECEICKKGFMQKSEFTRHLKSHSDVRP